MSARPAMSRSLLAQLVAMALFAAVGGFLWVQQPTNSISGLCGTMTLVLGVSASKPLRVWRQEKKASRS